MYVSKLFSSFPIWAFEDCICVQFELHNDVEGPEPGLQCWGSSVTPLLCSAEMINHVVRKILAGILYIYAQRGLG